MHRAEQRNVGQVAKVGYKMFRFFVASRIFDISNLAVIVCLNTLHIHYCRSQPHCGPLDREVTPEQS